MPALYDTFLIQEPLRQDPFAVTHNPDDTATRIGVYRKSILYFEERHRTRAVERLKYELGLLYAQQGEWERALKVLKPLWEGVSWRREGWWAILGALGEVLRESAVSCGDGETVIRAAWEGMSSFRPLQGACDLILTPGSKKVLCFDLIPKDSGIVRVADITSSIETDSFDFRHIVSQPDHMRQEDYWLQTINGLSRTPAGHHSSNEIRILPKPPKMQIEIPVLQKEYLTDETVTLEVEVTNDEDDDAKVTLEARFLGQADTVPTLSWTPDATGPGMTEDPLTDQRKKQIPSIQLGHIEQSGMRKIHIIFVAGPQATEAVLEIKALYHLIAEPDTPVTKLLVHEMVFDRPFEANCDFQPSIDPQPMPNCFHLAESNDPHNTAQGLRQLWTSTIRLASVAPVPLIIEDVTLNLNGIHDAAICTITTNPTTSQAPTIAPNCFHESRFDILTQKLDLDDRRSTTFTFHLQIRWRRNHPNASLASTTIPAPDLIVPFGEPRVLAAILPPPLPETDNTEAEAEAQTIIPLAYTIENPSTHVLTFSVSMETSDAFAFSGPKTISSLQLVPMSRRTLRYNVCPLVRGKWITPELRVLDTGFNQIVRVVGTAGGGGNMRSERKGGVSVWVDAEGE
ncbi:MAG: hypothetical protein Q9185_004395 [Variospora sp. 1 TL-2023]